MVSVRVLDIADVWQVLSPSAYVEDLMADTARIFPAAFAAWPVVSLRPGTKVEVLYDAGDVVPCVANQNDDTLTLRGHWPDPAVGDVVRLSNSGGALPAPLAPDIDYFVADLPAAGVLKLSATQGGAAIDITAPGTGTNFIGIVPPGVRSWILLQIGSMFANREGDAPGGLQSLPFADGLLQPSRIYME